MLLYKRLKKNTTNVSEETTSAIFNKWKIFKQKLAIKLQKKFELLSSQAKKYTLILFCVLFGGSSIVIIVHSIATRTKTIKVASISKPAHANEDGQSIYQPDSIITKQEYNRILQLKNYLLYLRSDSTEKEKYDSIIRCRPQLMDSIAMFERMYLSQTKK